jgi:CBS domain-containing protein
MANDIGAVLQAKGSAVRTVAPDDTVLDAVRQMNAASVGSLVVMDADELVGIFTERDVLVRLVEQRRDPADTRVREVMTDDPLCVGPDTSVEDTMILMTENHCRHVPVLEGAELRGVVSVGDLIRWTVRDRDVRLDRLLRAMRLPVRRDSGSATEGSES